MPCTDEGRDADEDNAFRDKMTRMLCEVLKENDHVGMTRALSQEVQIWWKQHQKWDRERKLAEKQTKCKHRNGWNIQPGGKRKCVDCGIVQKMRWE